LEVDDELEFCRLHDRQVGGLGALEDAAGIDADVASLARPGGNATGINVFTNEVVAKRLRLLHDLVPKAVRIAVLLNPANGPSAESTLRGVQEAAPALGLQIQIHNATTIGEIDAAFATLAHERPDALFVAPDAFFTSRRVQFVTLTARDRIPAAYSLRDTVAAGGLMSYGTDKRPSRTGSSATPKTIGIVAVAALAASAAGALPGMAITATRRRTRSAISAGLALPSASIRGPLTARASSSTSPVWRTIRLHSPPSAQPANAGPARLSPCGRVRE
jgi:hypothetical protein